MKRLTPILRVFTLLLFAVLLIAWGASYYWVGSVAIDGRGIELQRGIYYLFETGVSNGRSWAIAVPIYNDFIDSAIEPTPQRWKPVRAVSMGPSQKIVAIEGWVPLVALAVVYLWLWRSRRKSRIKGFEVRTIGETKP